MDICAELGRLHQDAAQTMGAAVLLLVAMIYWILKT